MKNGKNSVSTDNRREESVTKSNAGRLTAKPAVRKAGRKGRMGRMEGWKDGGWKEGRTGGREGWGELPSLTLTNMLREDSL